MNKIKRFIRRLMGRFCPKILVTILYKQAFGYWLDWKNPKNLNEKIQWLKFNSDTKLWSKYADKHRVREYIKEKGCSELLVKLYGVWENPSEIEWEKLPSKFVMKTNCGCGDIRICKDKNSINKDEWISHFRKVIKLKCGYERGEPHYNRIKPLIIAEELLEAENQSTPSSSLIDYKIWCFNGEPFCIYVCSNRTTNSFEMSLYDLDWNYHPEFLKESPNHKKALTAIARPTCLDKMLESSRILSKGLPQVRADFYEVGGKPYFGEMTMTGAGGFMVHFSPEFLLKMGSQIDLALNE